MAVYHGIEKEAGKGRNDMKNREHKMVFAFRNRTGAGLGDPQERERQHRGRAVKR